MEDVRPLAADFKVRRIDHVRILEVGVCAAPERQVRRRADRSGPDQGEIGRPLHDDAARVRAAAERRDARPAQQHAAGHSVRRVGQDGAKIEAARLVVRALRIAEAVLVAVGDEFALEGLRLVADARRAEPEVGLLRKVHIVREAAHHQLEGDPRLALRHRLHRDAVDEFLEAALVVREVHAHTDRRAVRTRDRTRPERRHVRDDHAAPLDDRAARVGVRAREGDERVRGYVDAHGRVAGNHLVHRLGGRERAFRRGGLFAPQQRRDHAPQHARGPTRARPTCPSVPMFHARFHADLASAFTPKMTMYYILTLSPPPCQL